MNTLHNTVVFFVLLAASTHSLANFKITPGLITDGIDFWMVNGDNSRNWISSPTSDCHEKATFVTQDELDAIPKRHDGERSYFDYRLSSYDSSIVCQNAPPGMTDAKNYPFRYGIVTLDGNAYWVLNGDGTRNWIKLKNNYMCKSNATRVNSEWLSSIQKRHSGESSWGYALEGLDTIRACNKNGIDLYARDDTIKVGLIADPQYANKNTVLRKYYRDSTAKLNEYVTQANLWNPDFSVVLGDLVDEATEENINEIDSVFQQLNHPRHYVLGNHDANQDGFDEFLKLTSGRGPNYYAFNHKGVNFIVLDANYNDNGGHNGLPWNALTLGEQQEEWLSETLRTTDGYSIILTHEPLCGYSPTGCEYNWQNNHVVLHSQRIRGILEKYSDKVLAVFSGHDHLKGGKVSENGVDYYTIYGMVEGQYGVDTNGTYAFLEINPHTGMIVLTGTVLDKEEEENGSSYYVTFPKQAQ